MSLSFFCGWGVSLPERRGIDPYSKYTSLTSSTIHLFLSYVVTWDGKIRRDETDILGHFCQSARTAYKLEKANKLTLKCYWQEDSLGISLYLNSRGKKAHNPHSREDLGSESVAVPSPHMRWWELPGAHVDHTLSE
jgi:hypothetical protein